MRLRRSTRKAAAPRPAADATNAAPTPAASKTALASAVEGPAASPDASDPVATLFNEDYDRADSDLLQLTPGRKGKGRAKKRARTPSVKKPASPSSSSPLGKQQRRGIVSSLIELADPAASKNVVPPLPPAIKRPSPDAVIANVFAKPKKTRKGPPPKTYLVHNSEFLTWARTEEVDARFGKGAKRGGTDIKSELAKIRRRIHFHFNEERSSRSSATKDEPERVLRSQVEIEDWVLDSDAINVETSDHRRLSRYCLEQLMASERNTKLLLLVDTSKDNEFFGGVGADVDNRQGIERAKISGREFYRLRCTITDDTWNQELLSGLQRRTYTEAKFMSDFKNDSGGFQVSFDDTEHSHTFSWRRVVAQPSAFMFFGPPLSSSRAFDGVFKKKASTDTLHRTFLSYYAEFEGDVNACLALYNAYLHRRLQLLEKELREGSANYDKNLFTSERVTSFLDRVDACCESSLVSCFTEMKNHAESIIDTQVFSAFIDEAPAVFGDFWKLLCDLRGIRPNQKREKDRTATKRNQVFFQLMAMARFANRKRLKNWAAILSVANYARGVGSSAAEGFSYWGSSLSNTARKAILARITGNDATGQKENDTLKDKQTKLLSSQKALSIAYDNFQRGLSLQNQRGGHSSAFFKGTHQCAHTIHPFEDTTFDAEFVDFTQYEQAIPSPWGMPDFRDVDISQPASFFLDHENYASVETPDFTGEVVDSYIRLRDIASHLHFVWRAFSFRSPDASDFEQCPSSFDREKLVGFNLRCCSERAKLLFAKARQFQRSVVLKWNTHADEPTMSCYLGLVAIDEAASKECGAITLDLLLRAGVLVEGDDGGWKLATDWKTRRIYLFGDAKTIENMTKFVRDMQNRRISYTDANIQSEIFLEALSCVMEVPGDWHTGMNMLQSIYKLYYTGFLDQFQDLLGWKRINKDVRDCYFQASRLVRIVFEELNRLFLHGYVSSQVAQPTPAADDAEHICNTAIGYMKYLRGLKASEDKWISTCANFLEMAYDFLEFVEAYRVGDAIAIEHGYQKHCPVWEVLGQSKYVERHYAQQETLYRDNPYSRLHELRMNRFVRRYHANTGKRSVAQDEFLEHGNRFFSEFPMPKSLTGFAYQSNFVGVGLMAKRFTDLWYTTKWKGNVPRNYNISVESKLTPEKKMLYEVLKLLGTHVQREERAGFSLTFITNVRDKITTDIRRDKLESSMKYALPSQADTILFSLNNVYEESIKTTGVDPLEEGENTEILEQIQDEFMMDDTPEPSGKPGKKKMHELILADPWELGRNKFAKQDIISTRSEATKRGKRKTDMRRAIIKSIGAAKENAKYGVVGKDIEGVPKWQRLIQSKENNLGLD